MIVTKIQKIFMKLYNIFMQKPCIWILKKWGLSVGKNLNVQNYSSIDISHCWLISIGDNVTLAPYSQIIAHDASTKKFIGYTKASNVKIGNNVFIGAGAIILPNVKIGDNVVIGAGSVVTKDMPSNSVCAGVPCKKIKDLDEYIKEMAQENKYDESYLWNNITESKKRKMKEELNGKIGLIV